MPQAVARGDQYLWGRDLLCRTCDREGRDSAALYLPRGDWYDYWTEEKFAGGREISRPVDLATMPLYVRSGSILPLGPVRQYTGEKVDGPLTLLVYPGVDGAFTLYEDDGATFDYRRGQWTRLQIEWKNARRVLSLRSIGGPTPPQRREIEIRIARESAVRKIVFEGRPIEVKL